MTAQMTQVSKQGLNGCYRISVMMGESQLNF
ncbi:hypothetical protein GGQ72_004741 [Rhizobium rhizoryzae]|uniref:Uncharacterized protein n=1 Tax=Rhizobium rhizoryzae TaxID=451876 RepID=A0A7W6LN66_9HYPH|nr:hypothetical protein [Rhizobium rhizoryzae]